MAIIRISGPAVVFDFRVSGDDPPVVEDPTVLLTLNGLRHSETFSDYIADGGDETLKNAGVSGGQLSFEFDSRSEMLFGVTEYSAPRLLSCAELALLKEYTIGQWSDGIGSNFFQNRMAEGLAPQLFFIDDQVVNVEQRN